MTCSYCGNNKGSFAFKEGMITCLDKDDTTKKLVFESSDSSGGPFNVIYGDLATNCLGDGDQVATDWSDWSIGTKGSLLLSYGFCDQFELPTDDPKHPPGFAIETMKTRTRSWNQRYDVEVIGVRLSVRFALNMRVFHDIDPLDTRMVTSHELEFEQGHQGKVTFDDHYFRHMILPDHPGVDSARLNGSMAHVRWVTALLKTSDGDRIDVALHDETNVVDSEIKKPAVGARGKIVLSQKAWSDWNLPTGRERAIKLLDQLEQSMDPAAPKTRGLRDPATILREARAALDSESLDTSD